MATCGISILPLHYSSNFKFLVCRVLLRAIANARQAMLERLIAIQHLRQFHPTGRFPKRHTSQLRSSSEPLFVFGFQNKPSHRLLLGSGYPTRLASGKVDGIKSKVLLPVVGMRIPNTPGVCEPLPPIGVRHLCIMQAMISFTRFLKKKSLNNEPEGTCLDHR